ncbi:iron-sulfur assembly protein IscA-like 2, mitochondrial isoform X1 [Asparagus officinalis]|uniref:iron-sulfur assembly protein IscA-like 2, mitochondrial isoform X1 n=1 Tax=Asparagus officinalis TaxID=4686 RepID=UPI00098E30AE|nr:iron-sulfur assembly protein IscA-like 2, mitochondrial isoform X1 [Asparagus officinalis]
MGLQIRARHTKLPSSSNDHEEQNPKHTKISPAMSTRSALRRLTPFIAGRIRQNSRLLSSSSSSAAAADASSSPSSSESQEESIHLTESCIKRLKELQAKQASGCEKMLRLSVETGGCSGFQYVFLLDDKRNTDDRVFEKGGVKLVVDNISYDFVKGATVDYVEELIRSAFVVATNPSAVGGCSCKSSFMVK